MPVRSECPGNLRIGVLDTIIVPTFNILEALSSTFMLDIYLTTFSISQSYSLHILSTVVREIGSSLPNFANVAFDMPTDLANSILLIPFSSNISHNGL